VVRVRWWSSEDPRRRAAFVAAMLVASAVVGLGVGALLGAAGGGGTTEASSTASPGTSSKTPSPSSTPSHTLRAASEIEPGATSDVGYFIGANAAKDGTHVTFDRVLLMLGQEARDYAKAHHKKRSKQDGVLLVNDNDLTRDLVLAPDVKVLGTQQLAGSPTPQPVPLQTLLDKVASSGADLLLDLTYDKLGYVTRVQEHDLATSP
jgi:hypothetical protein